MNQSEAARDVPSTGTRPLLSVVVPAYNEARTVERTLERLEETVGAVYDSYEIIVVDDGSDDSTARVLVEYAADRDTVECVFSEENHGKGHAIRTGARAADGELVLMTDADGDLTADRIATFVETLHETGADVVIGSKRHPDSEISYPLRRRILSRGYSALIRLLFGLQVTDTQVGMKLLRREVIADVMPILLVDRFAFDVELLVLAHDHGYTIREAPVSLEFGGHSSVDWGEVVRIGRDTLAIFLRLHLLRSYDLMQRAVQYSRSTEARDSEEVT